MTETELLDLIERHVSCALLSLGPKTTNCLPWYLMSITLRTGEARTYAAATRLDVLRQAAGDVADVPDDKAA